MHTMPQIIIHNISIFKILSLVFFSSRCICFVRFLFFLSKGRFILLDWELYTLESVILTYRLIFDWVTCSFLFVVFLISSAVMFYRDSYIGHEKRKIAFALIVFLFVISIIFLIVSPNLIRVILGWDGLGLVSYLLVIYYQNYKSYAAGILTCLRNRIGDRALLVAIGWFLSIGRLDFFFYTSSVSKEMLIAGIFITVAAMTKRAQIPFSSWLPAAMAAPTPVSALVHSSTLVTAGVFLLIRFFPLFSAGGIKSFLFISGALTMTMSRLGALYEMDFKKIIALSTLRQLGLMMMALSINLYLLAFFHLLTHALFKASLFLRAGRIIHLYRGRQDVRNLRAVTRSMPFTSSCLLICSFSLGGFPFLSAFYSKDKIIEERFSSGYNIICLFLLFVSILFTMVYRFRLISYISKERYDMRYEFNSDNTCISCSIGCLTLGGVIGGRLLRWLVFDLPYDNLWSGFKLLILIFLLIGLILGSTIKFDQVSLFTFFLRMIWFLPSLRTKMVRSLTLKYGRTVRKYWDGGWNELLGPQGLKEEIGTLSSKIDLVNHISFKLIILIRFLLILILTII